MPAGPPSSACSAPPCRGVTVFVVACPKDASMFTAALATLGVGDRLAVRELSELVAEALQPGEDGREV